MIDNFTNPFVKSLIIVDDDRDEHFLLRESIGECHYNPEIKTVQDGNQLLSVLSDGPLPDLILLDLNMPKKSGLECLNELRANEGSNGVPVIVLSTSKRISDMEACYDCGASLFFSKPYDFESMKSLIESILNIDWPHVKSRLPKADFLKIASEGSAKNFVVGQGIL